MRRARAGWHTKQAIRAAYTFQPLGSERISAILARTAPLGAKGEQFKTTERFDDTTKNPHWLRWRAARGEPSRRDARVAGPAG